MIERKKRIKSVVICVAPQFFYENVRFNFTKIKVGELLEKNCLNFPAHNYWFFDVKFSLFRLSFGIFRFAIYFLNNVNANNNKNDKNIKIKRRKYIRANDLHIPLIRF